jgi:hypothetical protein
MKKLPQDQLEFIREAMNNHKKSAPLMTMWIDQTFSHIDALHAELDELREEIKILHHAHFDALKQRWKLSAHSGTTPQSQAGL